MVLGMTKSFLDLNLEVHLLEEKIFGLCSGMRRCIDQSIYYEPWLKLKIFVISSLILPEHAECGWHCYIFIVSLLASGRGEASL